MCVCVCVCVCLCACVMFVYEYSLKIYKVTCKHTYVDVSGHFRVFIQSCMYCVLLGYLLFCDRPKLILTKFILLVIQCI